MSKGCIKKTNQADTNIDSYRSQLCEVLIQRWHEMVFNKALHKPRTDLSVQQNFWLIS